jgi:hypothetical protein
MPGGFYCIQLVDCCAWWPATHALPAVLLQATLAWGQLVTGQHTSRHLLTWKLCPSMLHCWTWQVQDLMLGCCTSSRRTASRLRQSMDE